MSDSARSEATRARKLYRGRNLNKLQQSKEMMISSKIKNSQQTQSHNLE